MTPEKVSALATLVGSLVWPLAVVFLLILFRKPISSLLLMIEAKLLTSERLSATLNIGPFEVPLGAGDAPPISGNAIHPYRDDGSRERDHASRMDAHRRFFISHTLS